MFTNLHNGLGFRPEPKVGKQCVDPAVDLVKVVNGEWWLINSVVEVVLEQLVLQQFFTQCGHRDA